MQDFLVKYQGEKDIYIFALLPNSKLETGPQNNFCVVQVKLKVQPRHSEN